MPNLWFEIAVAEVVIMHNLETFKELLCDYFHFSFVYSISIHAVFANVSTQVSLVYVLHSEMNLVIVILEPSEKLHKILAMLHCSNILLAPTYKAESLYRRYAQAYPCACGSGELLC